MLNSLCKVLLFMRTGIKASKYLNITFLRLCQVRIRL